MRTQLSGILIAGAVPTAIIGAAMDNFTIIAVSGLMAAAAFALFPKETSND
jgi:hypothetical protein